MTKSTNAHTQTLDEATCQAITTVLEGIVSSVNSLHIKPFQSPNSRNTIEIHNESYSLYIDQTATTLDITNDTIEMTYAVSGENEMNALLGAAGDWEKLAGLLDPEYDFDQQYNIEFLGCLINTLELLGKNEKTAEKIRTHQPHEIIIVC